MKRKIVGAGLLLLCFAWLALPSGAIPVDEGAETLRTEASAEPEEPAPAPTPEPVPETPAPAAEPSPAPPPTAMPTEAPAPRLVATTITSASLIDDTYFDIDPQAMLEEGLSLTLPAEGYQVLIIHTHTTEAYTPEPGYEYEAAGDYRTTELSCSVARVGEALAEALTAYGLHVLHDTTVHDYPSYSGSYARSEQTIAQYLEAYPGIRVVIDLHRDALGDDSVVYKTVTGDGSGAAQLMFVMGTDASLEHPGWRDNLRLALALQAAALARCDTLMRPIVISDYRYNQQLAPGSLLLEVGTAGNTLTEALRGVELFAEAAGPLLASLVE